MSKNKKNIKVRDLKPKKDAKGGGGFAPRGGDVSGGAISGGSVAGQGVSGDKSVSGGPTSNN